MLLRVAPPRPDDRWRVRERGARLSTIAVAILVASLLFHGTLLVVALFAPHDEAATPQEIPVEIVQAPPVETPKPAPAPPLRRTEPPPPPPAPVKAPDPAAEQRASLERELAALKAEQAALKTQDEGLGPLRDSTRALALPSVAADGDGEVVGYQALVFSQLAKAKEGLASKGVAGTVGVRFAVDEEGRLTDVAVAVSSGIASLDADALAIVRRAAPFPKPPTGAEHEFSANVAYAAPQ